MGKWSKFVEFSTQKHFKIHACVISERRTKLTSWLHTCLHTPMQTDLSANQSVHVLSQLFINVVISCAAVFRACLHGGGGSQLGGVTCGGSPLLSYKRDQIKMRVYLDRRVTHQSGMQTGPYTSLFLIKSGAFERFNYFIGIVFWVYFTMGCFMLIHRTI